MEIILLQKVRNLGALGERVKVKPGYARNFLIPNGHAIMATKANIEKFNARRAELEKVAADALAVAQKGAAKIAELGSVTIAARSGDEGKLFGSVSAADIADAMTAAGVAVAKHQVRMPVGMNTLRNLGEYTVSLHLYTDVEQAVTVNIVAE